MLPKLRIGTVVGADVFRKRFDGLLTVIAPLILMGESAYANGWVFANGEVNASLNTVFSMGRGLFMEVLVFVMFRMVRSFVAGRRWAVLPIPLLIGFATMIVSAGCTLGFVNRSGEMTHVVALVAQFLPLQLVDVFKISLGLAFPISVGAFALFDNTHAIEEVFQSAHHEARALEVHMAEENIKQVEKQIKRSAKEVEAQYADIVQSNTQQLVDQFRRGDRSFGLSTNKPVQSSVTRIAPVAQQQLPPAQPVFNSPAFPAGAPTGTTQNIVYPPTQPMQPPPQQGFNLNPFNRRHP